MNFHMDIFQMAPNLYVLRLSTTVKPQTHEEDTITKLKHYSVDTDM
jgi:hypothetical protein